MELINWFFAFCLAARFSLEHIYERHSTIIILTQFLITLSAKNTCFVDIFLEKKFGYLVVFSPFLQELKFKSF